MTAKMFSIILPKQFKASNYTILIQLQIYMAFGYQGFIQNI